MATSSVLSILKEHEEALAKKLKDFDDPTFYVLITKPGQHPLDATEQEKQRIIKSLETTKQFIEVIEQKESQNN